MNLFKDLRFIALAGGVLALGAGFAIAWFVLAHSTKSTGAPPAAGGAGLVVVSGRDDDNAIDPNRPLRCFVNGQFVGELPLKDCAARNGVATGALDVGLDQAGALAAATNGASSNLTPLGQQAAGPLPETGPGAAGGNTLVASADGAGGPAAACWRYGGAGWRQLPTPLPLMACVEAVFANRCPVEDDAFYARWGDQTLRLADNKVDISPDNRDFRRLVAPWEGCQDDAAG